MHNYIVIHTKRLDFTIAFLENANLIKTSKAQYPRNSYAYLEIILSCMHNTECVLEHVLIKPKFV